MSFLLISQRYYRQWQSFYKFNMSLPFEVVIIPFQNIAV